VTDRTVTVPPDSSGSVLQGSSGLLLQHRPAGAEHPYAASPDQRTPVLPEAGQSVRLGLLAGAEVVAVWCEWVPGGPDGGEPAVLALAPATAAAADTAMLAGGEGHLAEAQASAGTAGAGSSWAVQTPALAAGVRYRYRFLARTTAGEQAGTGWHEVLPASWTPTEDVRADVALHLDSDRLVPGSVAWLVNADGVHRARFALALRDDEHVVGFGERFDALDQRGRRLDAVVFEQYKGQGRTGRTYLPMPFAHVVGEHTPGWGLHVRTSRRTWFDVGATTPDRLVVEVALGGSGTESVEVGSYSGAPSDVLAAFTAEVGRAEELPDWVFRLWASGNEWNTQALVMSRMDTHRDLDIPVGVVVIEAWSDEQGITIFRDARYPVHADGSPHSGPEFRYPSDGAWPDPAAMIRELHSRGIRVLLWQIPLLKTRHDLGPDVPDDAQVLLDGAALVRDGHAVREADGSPYHNRGWWFPQALLPDLTVERTRQWWTAKRRYLVRDLDVDGFKTDGGEHAWGADLRYGSGRRGDEENNRYPVHYARAFGDLLRSEGKAPVTFSRAGFTGSQAHGVVWAGDEDSTWEAFRASMTAGLTAGACGLVYWGWDLAGFSGPVPDPELYLRATAASTFLPVMQYHSEFNSHRRPLRDRTPWFVAETSGDPEVVEVFRWYAELRERLVPYLAEQARVAIATGRPLLRALLFDYPHDPEIWSWPGEFQLGDALLVHPVTAPGATTWDTYLPRAGSEWVDVWTGEHLPGGQVVARDTPREVVPVYCRAEDWPRCRPLFTG